MSEQTNAPVKTKVIVSVSQLLADLENGIDRNQQAAKYGVSKKAIAKLYKSSAKLRNKKVQRPLSDVIELVDDTDEKGRPVTGTTAPTASTEADGTDNIAEATPEAVPEVAATHSEAIGERW